MDLEQQKAKARKKLIQKIIDQILAGKYDNAKELPNDLYSIKSREYFSPLERDTYNYGYTVMPEQAKG